MSLCNMMMEDENVEIKKKYNRNFSYLFDKDNCRRQSCKGDIRIEEWIVRNWKEEILYRGGADAGYNNLCRWSRMVGKIMK